MSDIEAKVKAAVAEQLGLDIEKVRNEAAFEGDLGADSLDQAELIMSFEKEFNISIPDEDSAELVTVQKAIDYIKDRI